MKLQTLFFILMSIPVLFGAGIVSIQMRSSLRDWRERNLSGYRVGWWVLLSLSVGLVLSLTFNWFHAYDRLLANEQLSRSVPGAVLIWLAVGGFLGFVLALLTTLPTMAETRE